MKNAAQMSDLEARSEGAVEQSAVDARSEVLPRTVIEPVRGWKLLKAADLWKHRELWAVLVRRDLRVRYQQTVLGVAWAVLRPLLAVGIFSVIFGRVAKLPSEGSPYPLFALAGVLPWTYFSSSLSGAAESLVGARQMVSKVFFPRLVLPLSALGTGIVDLLMGLLIFVPLSIALSRAHWLGLAWTPVLLVLLLLAAIGPAIFFAALNVKYRDVRHVLPFLIQLWMYATPVVFPASMVSEKWRPLLYLNPVAGPVEAFRAALLGREPDLAGIGLSILVGAVALVVGLAYFSRVERQFADVI